MIGPMKQVNMHEAKTHLSRLVEDVRLGVEPEIVIAVGNKPAAKIVPFEKSPRRLGLDDGLIEIGEDFDDPIPEFDEYFQ